MRFLLLAFDSALKLGYDAFGSHAHMKTFFQSALLAFAPHIHVDLAIVAVLALINGIFGDTSPEESFASLAREGIVMITRGSIATNKT